MVRSVSVVMEIRRSARLRKIPPHLVESTNPESRAHPCMLEKRASQLMNTTKCLSTKVNKTGARFKPGKLSKTPNKEVIRQRYKPINTRKAKCQTSVTESFEDKSTLKAFVPESTKKSTARKDKCNVVKDIQALTKRVDDTAVIVNRPKRMRTARRDICCGQTVGHATSRTSASTPIHDNPMLCTAHSKSHGASKISTSNKVDGKLFAQRKAKQLDFSVSKTTKQFSPKKAECLHVETVTDAISEGSQVASVHTGKRNGHKASSSITSLISMDDWHNTKKASKTPTSRHNKYQRFTCMETGVSMQINCHAILQESRRSKSKCSMKYKKYRRARKLTANIVDDKIAKRALKLGKGQCPKAIHTDNMSCQTSLLVETEIPKSTNESEITKTEESSTHSKNRTHSKPLPSLEQYTEVQHSRDLDDLLTCHLCGLLFTGRRAIERHMVIHCNSKTPICFCALCNKTFVEFEHLEAHVVTCRRFQRIGKEEEPKMGPKMDENVGRMYTSNLTDSNIDFRNDAAYTKKIRPVDDARPMLVVDTETVPTEIRATSDDDENMHVDCDEVVDPSPKLSFDSDFVCDICDIKFPGIFSLTEHYWVHEPQMVSNDNAGTGSTSLVTTSEKVGVGKSCWDSDRRVVYREDFPSIPNQLGEDLNKDAFNKDVCADSSAKPDADIDEHDQVYPNVNCNKNDCGQTIILDLSNSVKRPDDVQTPSAQTAPASNDDVDVDFSSKVCGENVQAYTNGCEQRVIFDLSNSVKQSDDAEHCVQTSNAHVYSGATSIHTTEERRREVQSKSVSNTGPIISSHMHDNRAAVSLDVSNRLSQSCNTETSPVKDLPLSTTQTPSGVDADGETIHDPERGEDTDVSESLYDCHHCQEKFKSESSLHDHMQQMGHQGEVQYFTVCSLEELEGYKPYQALQLNIGAVEVCLNDNSDQTYVIQEYSDNSALLVQESILANYPDVDILCQQCGHSFRNNMLLCHSPCFSTSKEEQKSALQELYESNIQIPNPVDKCGLYHCGKCMKTFPTKKELTKHQESHNISKECHICGKIVRTAFTKHVKSHNVEQQSTIVCEVCEEMFPSMQGLAFHQSSEHDFNTESATGMTYRCPHCKQELDNTPSFIAHVSAHTGVYPFECSICKRGYLYKAALTFHLVHHHSNNHGGEPTPFGEGLPETNSVNTLETGEGNLQRSDGPWTRLDTDLAEEGWMHHGLSVAELEFQGLSGTEKLSPIHPMYEQRAGHYQAPRQESTAEPSEREQDGDTMAWEVSKEYEYGPVVNTDPSQSMSDERLLFQGGSRSILPQSVHSERSSENTSEDKDQESSKRHGCKSQKQQNRQQNELCLNLQQPNDTNSMGFSHFTYTTSELNHFLGPRQQASVAEHHRECVDNDQSAMGRDTAGPHQKELNVQQNNRSANVEQLNTGENLFLDNDGHVVDNFLCNLNDKQLSSNWNCVSLDTNGSNASNVLPHFGEAFAKLKTSN